MQVLTKQALYDDKGNRISECYDSIEKNPGTEFFVVSNEINGQELYNFLTEDGKELSKEWFADVRYFEKSYEAVWVQRVDGSTNLLKRNGTFILNHKKYTVVSSLCNGAAIVRNKEDKENFVNSEGKLISKTWFKEAYLWENGGAIVEVSHNKYNYLKKDGTLLLEWSMPRLMLLGNNFETVYTDYKLWVISRPEFEIISEISCDVSRIEKAGSIVLLTNENRERNILSPKTGKLLWDKWKLIIRITSYQDYLAVAEIKENRCVWYLYNSEGKKVTEQEFEYIGEYVNGKFCVTIIKDGRERLVWFNVETLELEYEE